MQHSLVFIFSRKFVMIFTGAFFVLIYIDMSSSVSDQYINVTLSHHKEEVITSPGYPHTHYKINTNYTWDVRADYTTEEISMNITMDIHRTPGFRCEDFLLIQEINPSSGNFPVFKRCGLLTTEITAKGNRLLVTLVSNHDTLTSRGFEIIMEVLKVGTTSTTRTTSTPSTATIAARTIALTKARTSESTLKTTAVPLKTIAAAKVQTSSTTTTTSPKVTTQVTSLTPPRTTLSLAFITNATTSMKSKSPVTSMITTAALIMSEGKSTAPNKEITTLRSSSFQSTERRKTPYQTTTETQPKQSPPSETRNITTSVDTTSFWNMFATLEKKTATASHKEITTLRSSSFQSTERRKTPYQTTTETQPKQSPPSETKNTTTSVDTSFWKMFATLEKKTVNLLIGLGIFEVTLIFVGVLAVKRYRRKKKSNPSRQARKRNDGHTNSLKLQNSCGETNVYDEIDIDDVKEEKEENPYKELPEGVYDSTLKRRSHLKVVGERKSNYSRGSIINMFRTSSFFRRKVNETSVLTFSSFKGPIQSQIGEKK